MTQQDPIPPSAAGEEPGGRRASLVFLIAASGAQMGSLIIAALVTSSIVGAHGRGLMVIGLTTAGIVGLVAGLGSGPQLRASLPDAATDSERQELLSTFAWWTITAMALGAFVTILVCSALAAFIDPALNDAAFLTAMAVLAMAYVVQAQYPDLWYAIGRFREGSAWAVAAVLAGVAALLGALLITTDVATLLLVQGLAMLAVSAVQTVRLRRVGLLVLRRPDLRHMRRFIGSGAGVIGLTVGLAITLRLDRYVLGAVAGAGAVGVYSVASSMAQAPRLVPNATGQIVNRDAAVSGATRRPAKLTALSTVAVLAIGAALLLVSWIVVVPSLGPEFADVGPLILILVLAEAAFVPYSIASRTLMGRGLMRTAGLVGALWSVIALGVFAFAIGRWGATGAAVACLVVYAGISASYWGLMVRSDRNLSDAVVTLDRVPTAGAPAGLRGEGS